MSEIEPIFKRCEDIRQRIDQSELPIEEQEKMPIAQWMDFDNKRVKLKQRLMMDIQNICNQYVANAISEKYLFLEESLIAIARRLERLSKVIYLSKHETGYNHLLSIENGITPIFDWMYPTNIKFRKKLKEFDHIKIEMFNKYYIGFQSKNDAMLAKLTIW